MNIAVFTKNRSNPAYEAARLGADRAAAWLGAQTMHFVPAKGDDPQQQSTLIDAALALAPDAFVITPVHTTLVSSAIARINASGIPLVGFVNRMPAAHCVSYVGSDDYRLAFAAACYLFAHLEGRGNVLVVSGPVASVTSIPRVRAFHTAAKAYPGIVIVDNLVGDYLRDVARETVAQRMAGGMTFDGCLAANDIMAVGVLEALRAAGRTAAVVGVNAIPEAIDAIKRGEMLATADFNAMRMAFLATECAIRHIRGEQVPSEIELPVEIVDRRNCAAWDLPFTERPIPTLKETLKCKPGR